MRPRNLLLTIICGLVLVGSLIPYAWPQLTPYVSITRVDAPTTVRVRQAVTVNVTVSYSYDWASEEGLLIAILNLTNHPLPIRSRSSSCYFSSALSMCFARPPNSSQCCQGVFAASFTLTAPNQTEAWYLDIDAGITKLNVESSGYSILATSRQPLAIYVTPTPIPETNSATLLLVLVLLASAYLTKRKPRIGYGRYAPHLT